MEKNLEQWEQFVKELFARMGFLEARVEADPEGRRVSVFINDEYVPIKKSIMELVASTNYLIQMVARRENRETVFVDVNNYRRERERIILDLARAAAKKAQMTKQEISLPAMNAYERRLVHTELATRPDVKTESVGGGKERYVVIHPIE